jgi:hypothetical protein
MEQLQKAWTDGCLTRAEYAHALNELQQEERAEVVGHALPHWGPPAQHVHPQTPTP